MARFEHSQADHDCSLECHCQWQWPTGPLQVFVKMLGGPGPGPAVVTWQRRLDWGHCDWSPNLSRRGADRRGWPLSFFFGFSGGLGISTLLAGGVTSGDLSGPGPRRDWQAGQARRWRAAALI